MFLRQIEQMVLMMLQQMVQQFQFQKSMFTLLLSSNSLNLGNGQITNIFKNISKRITCKAPLSYYLHSLDVDVSYLQEVRTILVSKYFLMVNLSPLLMYIIQIIMRWYLLIA